MRNSLRGLMIALLTIAAGGCHDDSFIIEDRVAISRLFTINAGSAYDPVLTFDLRQTTINIDGDIETDIVAMNSNAYQVLDSVTYVVRLDRGYPYNDIFYWSFRETGIPPSGTGNAHRLRLDPYCCYPDIRESGAALEVINFSHTGNTVSQHPFGGLFQGTYSMTDTTGNVISFGTLQGYSSMNGSFLLRPQTDIYAPVRVETIFAHMSYEGVLFDVTIAGRLIYQQTGLSIHVAASQAAVETPDGYNIEVLFEYPWPYESLIIELTGIGVE